jgi:hypothetical protein
VLTPDLVECDGQGDLLALAADEAHARATDPATSHEAARSVKVRESQRQVLALLRLGPATDQELATRAYERGLRISPSGLRSRRHELVDAGLVEDTGRRAVLASGRKSAIWRAVA